jgi:hypothetical protein
MTIAFQATATISRSKSRIFRLHRQLFCKPEEGFNIDLQFATQLTELCVPSAFHILTKHCTMVTRRHFST